MKLLAGAAEGTEHLEQVRVIVDDEETSIHRTVLSGARRGAREGRDDAPAVGAASRVRADWGNSAA